jgi:hypothetical protein
VDVDAYVAAHEPEWRRLDAWSSGGRLTGDEVDELVLLYQRTTTHLSAVRSRATCPRAQRRAGSPGPGRGHPARTRRRGASGVSTVSFPDGLPPRWWWLARPPAAAAFHRCGSPARRMQAALLPKAVVRKLVNHQFQG